MRRYYLWGSIVPGSTLEGLEGFIYLAQLVDADGPGLLKIGWSTSPPKRVAFILAQMRRYAAPAKPDLRLLKVFVGSRKDETALHRALRKKYQDYNGYIGTGDSWREWYSPAQEVQETFDSLASERGGLLEWKSMKFPVEVSK